MLGLAHILLALVVYAGSGVSESRGVEIQHQAIRFRLDGERIVSHSGEGVSWFVERGYGEKDDKGLLQLSPIEALYLVEVGKIEIFNENGEKMEFDSLVKLFAKKSETLWRDYVIYRDLRRRRYVMKEGFSPQLRFRVFERGEYGEAPAKYIIIPLSEGKDISVSTIAELIRSCRSMDKEPVLAVVDRRNEVVYYSASIADLKNV
ncbi:MAG: tRNA-intron lyase [Aigarchaeota archaeon]|nr:tRNA-intron lyase [Candidatus Pelearchaeum maunauluense]